MPIEVATATLTLIVKINPVDVAKRKEGEEDVVEPTTVDEVEEVGVQNKRSNQMLYQAPSWKLSRQRRIAIGLS